ncbi:MAG: hypothetical protein AAF561_00655 [Planctomycetota bacterium]
MAHPLRDVRGRMPRVEPSNLRRRPQREPQRFPRLDTGTTAGVADEVVSHASLRRGREVDHLDLAGLSGIESVAEQRHERRVDRHRPPVMAPVTLRLR